MAASSDNAYCELSGEEIALTGDFFMLLSRSGRAEAETGCNRIVRTLSQKRDEAKRVYLEKSRVYCTLGVLLGVGMAILML